jgi:hypothetical protein
MAMRRFELDDLVNRPGTYFNPQTEVLVVVDDSPDMDAEIFDMEEAEGADWVLVSEDLPIDEHTRDELLERFQSTHSPTAEGLLETGDDERVDEDHDEFDGYDVKDVED